MRSIARVFFLSVGTICACKSAPPAPAPPAVAGVPPTFDPDALVEDAHESYERLKDADSFDGPRVGYSGSLSSNASRFRVLLKSPSARSAFLSLFKEGSGAGRLYAACGIYFVDPPSFDAAVKALCDDHETIRRMEGCVGGRIMVSEIAFDPKHIEIPAGMSLKKLSPLGLPDVAGGYICLDLAEDDGLIAAPRGPARF